MKRISTVEMAKRLGCSSRHVVNLIKKGQLKAIRIGERKFTIEIIEAERFEQCGWSGIETDGTSISQMETNQGAYPAGRGIVLRPK